tara:strand:+ start:1767 stop:2471 length:705 start_codon:yes stop_codon:yes gene_type:complete
MSLDINFSSPFKNFIEEPRPSLKYIPEEYKKFETFFSPSPNDKTVKKCIPFLDSLTCGYIIPFAVDIHFRYDQEKEKVIFELNHNTPEELKNNFLVDFHNEKQISKELRHNSRSVEAIFKFESTWTITTPPGYSCIFTQPFNRNFPFKIVDGIVDTDKYDKPVNFPFYWTNPVNKPLVLKAGTPMVLVIPFKRESWKMNIKMQETPHSRLDILKYFSKIYDNYKTNSWSKKQFK